ncbi:hypothetical protein D3C78_1994120 [compost metagenome]
MAISFSSCYEEGDSHCMPSLSMWYRSLLPSTNSSRSTSSSRGAVMSRRTWLLFLMLATSM